MSNKPNQKSSRKGKGAPRREQEFKQEIIDLARVTRVMKGGKRMRFRACVAIGDMKGRVGIGVAKGLDVTMAINKAVNRAKKSVVTVPVVKRTIPYAITKKFGAAIVMIKPARPGTGVKAGGPVRTVFELAGVNNIVAKNLGSGNKVNIVSCVIEAIKDLQRIEVKTDNALSREKKEKTAEQKEKIVKNPAVKKTVKEKK